MPEAAISKAKSEPAVVAFLAVVFAVPFSSGQSLWYLVYTFAFLLLFVTYAFFATRRLSLSLLAELKQHHSATFWLMVLFAVSSAFSFLRIIAGEYSLLHKLLATLQYSGYVMMTLYCFQLARFCLLKQLDYTRIALSFSGGMLVLVLILSVFYLFTDTAEYLNWSLEPPVGTHPRMMGIVALVSQLSCIVVLLLGDNTLLRKAFLYICLFVASSFMVWTGSRMSMAVAVVMICLLFVLSFLWNAASKKAFLSIILIIVCAVPVAEKLSVFNWNGLSRAVKASVINTGEGQDFIEATDRLTSGRMEIWQAAVQAAMEAPLFGLGPFGYFFIENRPPLYDHPHNLFIQFFTEWGVIGGSLLVLLLLSFARIGLGHIKAAFINNDTSYVLASTIVLALTMNAMTDGTYFVLMPLFVLVTAFAFFPFLTHSARLTLTGHKKS